MPPVDLPLGHRRWLRTEQSVVTASRKTDRGRHRHAGRPAHRTQLSACILADCRVGQHRQFVGALLDPLTTVATRIGEGAVRVKPATRPKRVVRCCPIIIGPLS